MARHPRLSGARMLQSDKEEEAAAAARAREHAGDFVQRAVLRAHAALLLLLLLGAGCRYAAARYHCSSPGTYFANSPR